MKKSHKGHVMAEKNRAGLSPKSSSRPGKSGRKIPVTGEGVDKHTLGRTGGMSVKPMVG